MRRMIFLIFVCLLALPTACSNQPVAPADDEAALKESVKMWLRDILRENPDIIFDILADNNHTLFTIVDAGFREHQALAQRDQRRNQLASGEMPPIDPARPMRGPEDAPITIVEFSDFQCPFCSQASSTVNRLMQKYKGKIRKVYRHMPLSSHKHAQAAAAIFEAASLQDEGKAWELYRRFFDNQEAIETGGVDWLMSQAGEVGLDLEQLNRDAAGEVVLNRIKSDLEQAQRFGIQGTPSFFFNSVTVNGALTLEEYSEIVEFILEESPETSAAPSDASAEEATGNSSS